MHRKLYNLLINTYVPATNILINKQTTFGSELWSFYTSTYSKPPRKISTEVLINENYSPPSPAAVISTFHFRHQRIYVGVIPKMEMNQHKNAHSWNCKER